MPGDQLVRDPLGNSIFIMQVPMNGLEDHIDKITGIISSPSFVINEGNQKLYYFGLIATDINLLIEAERRDADFIVAACIRNPSVNYISLLLQKGPLISFP